MNHISFRRSALLLCIVFLGAVLFTACATDNSAPSAYRVVQEIRIVYQNSGLYRSWHFYSNEKMEAILNCLRLLDPYGTPEEDPMLQTGSDLFITLVYSDNTTKVYHRRDDRFLQIGNGPWTRIDSDGALRLDALLATLISDERPDADTPFSSSTAPLVSA